MTTQKVDRKAHLVGGGIASLAAAAHLIRDGGLLGANISVYEQTGWLGGALDARTTPDGRAFVMRGERMFEEKYLCLWELLSFVPSLEDPTTSVARESEEFSARFGWYDRARLVDNGGQIIDPRLGLGDLDRAEMFTTFMEPEAMLQGRRISDCFSPGFFRTNFWAMWKTMFGFQTWHSAVEMRRYLLRFQHLFYQIPTLSAVWRTKYGQYDSVVRPLVGWLSAQGVRFLRNARVIDLEFRPDVDETTVTALHTVQDGARSTVPLGPGDLVMVTNGSMVADFSLGSNDTAPELIASKADGSWALWETLARGRPEFGNPSAFCDHVEESKWESFTVTTKAPLFAELFEKFSGSGAGRGGITSFRDSAWGLSICLFHQPMFPGQPEDWTVWWGYGLFPDAVGDSVRKPMAECTGAEVLEEVLRHLKFDEALDEVRAASVVIPCMMPYVTSQFLVRRRGDRPEVVPPGSTNLAFLGQYAEVPEDVVFTVEYSVRTARTAVDRLLGLNSPPPAVYHGSHHPRVVWESIQMMFR